MITKDRYSKAAIILMLCFTAYIAALKTNSNKNITAIPLLIAAIVFLYLVYLTLQPAKLHITDEQKKRLQVEYKPEEGKFQIDFTDEIDGIKINGVRYKFSNGTDAYIDSDDTAKPCGFGSEIVQYLKGGAKEPASIQGDINWQ